LSGVYGEFLKGMWIDGQECRTKIQGVLAVAKISHTKHLENDLRANATKLQNLLPLVERGVNLDTILPRIKEIESEKCRLEREVEKFKRLLGYRDAVRDATQEATKFMLSFRDKIRRAPILEQKFLIRQIIQGITVDRAKDEKVIRSAEDPKN
jgi:hypothetical protein